MFGGFAGVFGCKGRRDSVCKQRFGYVGSFPLTVTVTTMGNRSYNSPLNKAPLRTVTGRGNDPTDMRFSISALTCLWLLGFGRKAFHGRNPKP